VEVRFDRVVSDRLHENRTALPPIRQEPAPKVGTLARSTDCSPTAAEEREVQKKNRVRRTKPDINNVKGPQVTIHNPSLFRDKPLLDDHPVIARYCDKAWPPEDLVQLYTGSPVISPKRTARVDLPEAPRPMMTARFIVSNLRDF
jgi:hypothetical protein